MRIQNLVEPAVNSSVAEAVEELDESRSTCWCPLCEADVKALALTNLPPCYCTDHTNGEKLTTWKARASRAVTAASVRVAKRPGHKRLRPEPYHSTVDIVNFVFGELAALVVQPSSCAYAGCSCNKCTDDAMAYTLNRYPSKYGVVLRGKVKLPEHQKSAIREELQIILSKARDVVASNPNHIESGA